MRANYLVSDRVGAFTLTLVHRLYVRPAAQDMELSFEELRAAAWTPNLGRALASPPPLRAESLAMYGASARASMEATMTINLRDAYKDINELFCLQ